MDFLKFDIFRIGPERKPPVLGALAFEFGDYIEVAHAKSRKITPHCCKLVCPG